MAGAFGDESGGASIQKKKKSKTVGSVAFPKENIFDPTGYLNSQYLSEGSEKHKNKSVVFDPDAGAKKIVDNSYENAQIMEKNPEAADKAKAALEDGIKMTMAATAGKDASLMGPPAEYANQPGAAAAAAVDPVRAAANVGNSVNQPMVGRADDIANYGKMPDYESEAFEELYDAMWNKGRQFSGKSIGPDGQVIKNYEEDYNWKPFTQFVDDTWGGNLASTVEAPIDYDDRRIKLAQIKRAIAERRSKFGDTANERADKIGKTILEFRQAKEEGERKSKVEADKLAETQRYHTGLLANQGAQISETARANQVREAREAANSSSQRMLNNVKMKEAEANIKKALAQIEKDSGRKPSKSVMASVEWREFVRQGKDVYEGKLKGKGIPIDTFFAKVKKRWEEAMKEHPDEDRYAMLVGMAHAEMENMLGNLKGSGEAPAGSGLWESEESEERGGILKGNRG